MTMKVVDYPIRKPDFLLWRLQASLKVVDTARSLLLERPSDDDIEPAIIQILEDATRDARELMERGNFGPAQGAGDARRRPTLTPSRRTGDGLGGGRQPVERGGGVGQRGALALGTAADAGHQLLGHALDLHPGTGQRARLGRADQLP